MYALLKDDEEKGDHNFRWLGINQFDGTFIYVREHTGCLASNVANFWAFGPNGTGQVQRGILLFQLAGVRSRKFGR